MARIPQFKSDKEAAEFWDKHSLADFENDLRPTKGIVFTKPERQVVSLRLDRNLVGVLKRFAHQKGIGYSALVRMWVLERLDQERHFPLRRKAA